jgi:hypothetical protein
MAWDDDDDESTHIFGGDPATGAVWQVNVSESETRTMTAVEIGVEYGRGNLDPNDVFVWREGMSEWLPLGKCHDLTTTLAQYPRPRTPSAASAPGHMAAPLPYPSQPGAAPAYGYGPAASAPMSPSGSGYGAGPVPGGLPRPTAPPKPPVKPPSPPANPAARPRQASVPQYAALAPLSGGQSPLRQPMASNPAMQSGAFSALGPGGVPLSAGQPGAMPGNFAQGNFAQVAPNTAPGMVVPATSPMPMAAFPLAQVPAKQGGGLRIALIAAGGVVLLAGIFTAGFFLLRSPAQQQQAAAQTTKPSGKDPVKDEDSSSSASDQGSSSDTKTSSDSGSGTKTNGGTGSGANTKATSPADKKDAPGDKKDEKKDGDKKDAGEAKTATPEKKDDPKPGGSDLPSFNVDAARSALASAANSASGCGKPGGPNGRGRATVTFAPSGAAVSASVDPPFAGTPVGACAVAAFRSARVPPFSGSTQSVTKSFFVK